MVCQAAILFPTSMVSTLGGYGAHDACMEGGVVEPAARLTEPESGKRQPRASEVYCAAAKLCVLRLPRKREVRRLCVLRLPGKRHWEID